MTKRGRTPGPQRHAEGSHGDKTRRRFIEQLQDGTSDRRQAGATDRDGDDVGSDARTPPRSDDT